MAYDHGIDHDCRCTGLDSRVGPNISAICKYEFTCFLCVVYTPEILVCDSVLMTNSQKNHKYNNIPIWV